MAIMFVCFNKNIFLFSLVNNNFITGNVIMFYVLIVFRLAC